MFQFRLKIPKIKKEIKLLIQVF